MNKFCNRLSINIFPLVNQYNIYIDKPHVIVNLKFINPDINQLLKSCGITISHVEIFKKDKNSVGQGIHTDLDGLSNHVKINWIVNGKDSHMLWFDKLDTASGRRSLTSVNTTYTRHTLKDVKLAYKCKTKQGYPYLIETAVPHQVINPIETRYAICCVLSDLNKKRISMQHAQSLLSDYILDEN